METLGQVLSRYRTSAKMSVEDFSILTKIPPKVIRALEADDYSRLSEETYIKGHIKTYANYLNLSHEKLVKLFEEQAKDDKYANIKRGQQTPTAQKTRVLVTPRIIQIAIISLVAVVLIAYLAIQVSNIFQPPFLEISNPSQNLVISEGFIHIQGLTERESLVRINDKEISTQADGSFSTTLDLNPGLNLIKVTAKKKHSKESVIFREILVE